MHLRLEDIAPFTAWLRMYRRAFFRADVFAGLTVAVVAVPQSMAYALIAGLPVQYGLYASIVPTLLSCLWGSSSHLITGPTTAISLVVFSTLAEITPAGSPAFVEFAFFLALMVGCIQIAMGIARLGSLLNFVSHAVLLGFSTGAAVLIAFKQVPGLLGIRLSGSGDGVHALYEIFTRWNQIHWPTLILGLATAVIIVGVKRFRPNWPGALFAMVAAGSAVAFLNLDEQGVAVVGNVPRMLPPFHLPEAAVTARAGKLVPGALAIAILGLVEAVSIARAIADQSRQRLNINREFIGQGLANLAAGLFSGYAGSGSFTRSAVNFRSGARTPVSGIVSALAVAAVVVIAAPLAARLPLSGLAGVLLVVARDMVRGRDIARVFRSTRSDAAVLAITFLATLTLNIEFAVYVGVILSITLHLAATSHPRIYSVVPDLRTGKMTGSAHGEICCQADVVQIEGSVFFGSAAFVLEDLQRRLRSHPEVTCLIVRMHQVTTLDASGIHLLEIVEEELRGRGGGLYFSGVNHRVFEVLKNSGLLEDIGQNHVRSSTGAAIRQAMRENFRPAVCAACERFVFRECPELKQGNWEIFGIGVRPRQFADPPGPAGPERDAP